MIYDIVISDQAEIDLRGILIICRRDIDNMNWNHGKVEGYAQHQQTIILFYIPDDDTQVVTIIRVMYGGRDVNTQLNRFTKTK